MIYPSYLKPGDQVAIVSPSSKIEKAYIEGSVARLESWGLRVKVMPHADAEYATFAGTAAERVSDLQQAFDDEEVRAVLCSRGGYGVVHLLGKIDFTAFRRSPKWLIGFSDITALHNMIQVEGFASLHAVMGKHLTLQPADDEASMSLHDVLFGKQECGQMIYKVDSFPLNRIGSSEGVLYGGNMAVFNGLRGTRFDVPLAGRILFIEDVEEKPHSIERMMYNLKLGGVLEHLSGLIVGQFTEYEEHLQLGKPVYEALYDLVAEYDYPVCFDFPVGHVKRNLALIEGGRATLCVEEDKVRLIQKL